MAFGVQVIGGNVTRQPVVQGFNTNTALFLGYFKRGVDVLLDTTSLEDFHEVFGRSIQYIDGGTRAEKFDNELVEVFFRTLSSTTSRRAYFKNVVPNDAVSAKGASILRGAKSNGTTVPTDDGILGAGAIFAQSTGPDTDEVLSIQSFEAAWKGVVDRSNYGNSLRVRNTVIETTPIDITGKDLEVDYGTASDNAIIRVTVSKSVLNNFKVGQFISFGFGSFNSLYDTAIGTSKPCYIISELDYVNSKLVFEVLGSNSLTDADTTSLVYLLGEVVDDDPIQMNRVELVIETYIRNSSAVYSSVGNTFITPYTVDLPDLVESMNDRFTGSPVARVQAGESLTGTGLILHTGVTKLSTNSVYLPSSEVTDIDLSGGADGTVPDRDEYIDAIKTTDSEDYLYSYVVAVPPGGNPESVFYKSLLNFTTGLKRRACVVVPLPNGSAMSVFDTPSAFTDMITNIKTFSSSLIGDIQFGWISSDKWYNYTRPDGIRIAIPPSSIDLAHQFNVQSLTGNPETPAAGQSYPISLSAGLELIDNTLRHNDSAGLGANLIRDHRINLSRPFAPGVVVLNSTRTLSLDDGYFTMTQIRQYLDIRGSLSSLGRGAEQSILNADGYDAFVSQLRQIFVKKEAAGQFYRSSDPDAKLYEIDTNQNTILRFLRGESITLVVFTGNLVHETPIITLASIPPTSI